MAFRMPQNLASTFPQTSSEATSLPAPSVSSQALVQTLSSLRMALAFSCLGPQVMSFYGHETPSLPFYFCQSLTHTSKPNPNILFSVKPTSAFHSWSEQLPPTSSHCAGFALIFPHSTQADLVRVVQVLCWAVSS